MLVVSVHGSKHIAAFARRGCRFVRWLWHDLQRQFSGISCVSIRCTYTVSNAIDHCGTTDIGSNSTTNWCTNTSDKCANSVSNTIYHDVNDDDNQSNHHHNYHVVTNTESDQRADATAHSTSDWCTNARHRSAVLLVLWQRKSRRHALFAVHQYGHHVSKDMQMVSVR
jgi:hypothetical protein